MFGERRGSSVPRVVYAALVACLAAACVQAQAAQPRRVSTDYSTEASVTAGIQEALDSLPETGGTVYVPAGVHVVHRTVFVRDHVTLEGAGRATVIQKDPALRVPLAEDVREGSDQNYVVVADAADLRPGMGFIIGDMQRADADVFIDRIEGNRVFLTLWSVYSLDKWSKPWTPKGDILVERDAALVNGFPVIEMGDRAVIRNLSVDGNKEAQKLGGEELYKEVPDWWKRLRCAPYLGGHSRLEHCWLYNAAGVCVSLGGPTVIRDCEIWGSLQGIHPGAGPNSRIVNNDIHHHEWDGIGFCLGNYGLIVSHNHIHDNKRAGIGPLGNPEDRAGRGGDHFSVLSENVIYRNGTAGIASGQGTLGPCDFIITGNVILNNGRAMERRLAAHSVPAGISLYNAQRCLVTGNRCLDDQEDYPAYLSEPAQAGDTVLHYVSQMPGQYPSYCPVPFKAQQYQDFPVRIAGEEASEVRLALRISGTGYRNLELAEPLAHDYPEGATVTPVQTQQWGIFLGGPRARDNIVADNLCVGNAIGGVLWNGENTSVHDNLGGTVRLSEDRPLAESVYPAAASVPLANPGFEDAGGWTLTDPGAAFVEDAVHSGDRALKLSQTDGQDIVQARSEGIALEPNTRYRLTAWVRTEAKKGDRLVEPTIFLYGEQGTIALAAHPAVRADFERPEVTAGEWIRVSTEGRTGPEPQTAHIYCRLDRDMLGAAWVDDLALTALADGPATTHAGAQAEPRVQAPGVPAAPRIDGMLDEPAWQQAGVVRGFRLPDGAPCASETTVRVCHDAANLYVGFACPDDAPARLAERTAAAEGFSFGNDCVAVLLQPNPHDASFHYQLGVAANGAAFDQVCTDYDRDTEGFRPRWTAAAALTDRGWSAEMALPFRTFSGLAPLAGGVWSVNFARVRADPQARETGAWTATENWHRVQDYGRLVFAQ